MATPDTNSGFGHLQSSSPNRSHLMLKKHHKLVNMFVWKDLKAWQINPKW